MGLSERAVMALTGLRLGCRFQIAALRGDIAVALLILTTPISTIFLILLFKTADNFKFAGAAPIGAGLVNCWSIVVIATHDVFESDRLSGRYDRILTSPLSPTVFYLSRCFVIASVAVFCIPVAVLVGMLAQVPVRLDGTPYQLFVVLIIILAGMFGLGSLIGAAAAQMRAPAAFMSAVSYPLMLVCGVLVPNTWLPNPVQWLTSLVFLTPTAQLLRTLLGVLPAESTVSGLLVTASVASFVSIGLGTASVHVLISRLR